MSARAITRALAERNGGPGLTEAELMERTGMDRASLRSELARLTYERHEVTCSRGLDAPASAARFRLGDPRTELVPGNPATALVTK